ALPISRSSTRGRTPGPAGATRCARTCCTRTRWSRTCVPSTRSAIRRRYWTATWPVSWQRVSAGARRAQRPRSSTRPSGPCSLRRLRSPRPARLTRRPLSVSASRTPHPATAHGPRPARRPPRPLTVRARLFRSFAPFAGRHPTRSRCVDLPTLLGVVRADTVGSFTPRWGGVKRDTRGRGGNLALTPGWRRLPRCDPAGERDQALQDLVQACPGFGLRGHRQGRVRLHHRTVRFR